MPSLSLVAGTLSDLLRNAVTGFYEDELPTTPERTERRRAVIVAACERLLDALVGPGDLLGSDIRSEFAKEAYYCSSGECPCQYDQTCLRDPVAFATYNQKAIPHIYSTQSPFRDIAHAIVNKQERLNEAFFNAVVERCSNIYPKSQGFGEEEHKAMAVELSLIAACCAGIHDIFFALGNEKPPFPDPVIPIQPARFQKVSDYMKNPLCVERKVSWAPFVQRISDFRPEVAKKHDFDMSLWLIVADSDGKLAPAKGTPAPTTCMEWLRFMEATYGHPARLPRVFRRLGDDRCLTRAQLEITAEAYSSAKHCGH